MSHLKNLIPIISLNSLLKDQAQRKKNVVEFIETKPKFYLGLNPPMLKVMKIILERVSWTQLQVYITFKKIRFIDQYTRLADDFNGGTTFISTSISKATPLLANLFQELIFWPSYEIIKKSYLLGFDYDSVMWSQSYCFEIQIQKPQNAVKQAHTWSDYKKCNTIKYLISITSNGLINYVSNGFGGRASDKLILEQSGYLDIIPENVDVMADRGFKHVASSWQRKKL